MLHILFLTHWYPSRRNPIEGIFVQEHARAIAERHKVTVIHVLGIAQDAAGPVEKEIDPSRNLAVYHVSYFKPALPKTAWLKRLQAVERLYRQLCRGDRPPDLIHAHVYSSADLAVYLGQKYHLPTVLSEHASAYARRLFTPGQARNARFFLNRIDRILPVCQTLQDRMQQFGVRGPFEIIPNTVDAGRFYPAPDRPPRPEGSCRILQVASLNENKSVHDLIQAAPILRRRFATLEIHIVGEGPQRARLEALAADLGVTGNICFTGLQTKAQVAERMRAADCLAITSKWENQPVAALEALMCGLPVVAAHVGGLPEIISAGNGLLTPPGDPLRLAEAIVQVVDSPESYLPRQISEQAQLQFSYPAVAGRFDACYQGVLRSKRK